jgi:uncharacterized oligopeptide transporter (OPT) family protein
MSSVQPPQLTFRAVVLAIVLAVILSAANAYLGLFAGLTIATAIPAAVVSMGVLRLLGGGTILENNIVQTGASAGSSIAAGVIFTIPALIILGYWQDFKYWWVLAIAGLGGLLGVLFSVPLRRSMIVEDPLPFPEGKAAAEVLKAGENPGPGLKILGISASLGGLVKLAAESGLRMIPDNAAGAGFFGKYLGYMGTNLSPALLGVGYIVGLNIGIVVLSGSILVLQHRDPALSRVLLPVDPEFAQAPRRQDRGGSGRRDLAAEDPLPRCRRDAGRRHLDAVLAAQVAAVGRQERHRRGAQGCRGANVADTERDLPMKWMLIALVLFVLPLLALYQAIVGNWIRQHPDDDHHDRRRLPVRVGVGYLAGLVGSSNNPVSGITIATILFASVVLMLLMGSDSKIGAVAAIMIGAVVCCAAAVGGDNLQDLKAGYLVGATPWKQQLMLGIGAFSCALIMAPVLNLLVQAYGIGVPDGRIRIRCSRRRPR